VAGLPVLMAQFLDPSKGPDQTGGFQVSPTYFIVLFFAGFLVGGLGHLYKSNTLKAIGVGFVLLSTVVLPLALALTR
jgi:hypothetical protein